MARTRPVLRLPDAAAMAPPPLGLTAPSQASIPALRALVPDALGLELRSREGMSLTFAEFVLAGAVPPYSPFLLAVLRHYGIRLAHLPPSSILTLSVFAHLCVRWLRVPPSLDLFRHFFHCRRSPGASTSAIGSCFFRLNEQRSATGFIDMPHSTNWFRGWRGRWLYIQDDSSGIDETAVPAAPAVKRPSWDAEAPDTVYLRSLRGRVAELQRHGLTGAEVMLDALKHRLAPLGKDMEIFPAEADIMSCMVKIFGTKMAKMAAGEEDDDGDQVDGGEAVDDEEEADGNARSPPRPRQRTTGCILRLHQPVLPFRRGEEEGGEEDDGVDEEDDGDEVDDDQEVDDQDDVVGSAPAPHLLLPQSLESIQVVGSKRPLSTAVVGRKLDKFSKIQEEANANRMKVLELQQKMSSDKIETAKLAHLTAQENRESKKLEMERKKLKMESKKLKMEGKKLEKESKMMDTYNNLVSQDTSSMTDEEKSERVAAMRSLRKMLFPEII